MVPKMVANILEDSGGYGPDSGSMTPRCNIRGKVSHWETEAPRVKRCGLGKEGIVFCATFNSLGHTATSWIPGIGKKFHFLLTL